MISNTTFVFETNFHLCCKHIFQVTTNTFTTANVDVLQTLSFIICVWTHTKIYARCLRKSYVEICKVHFARRVVNAKQHRYVAEVHICAHTYIIYRMFTYADEKTKKKYSVWKTPQQLQIFFDDELSVCVHE